MFAGKETQGRYRGRGRPTADLVFAVFSESTARYDRLTKADTYAALGVRELRPVDLQPRTIERRVLDGERSRVAGSFLEGQTVQSQVLPGFEVPVSGICQDIPQQ